MIRFDEYVNRALYAEPGGFFADGGGAGRAGADFLTSPEVGPLFGAVVANYLDERWASLGEPDEFHVIEAAAGRGALAIAVLAAEPRCGASLRYHLVERSERLRSRHGDHLAVDGTLISSRTELPAEPVDCGVVIANELLDNIAFRLLVRSSTGWEEVWVDGSDGQLQEVLLPADATTAAFVEDFVPDAAPGVRVPLQRGAAVWLSQALATVGRGSVLCVDYGDTTPVLAGRDPGEWLRTYRSHSRGDGPLESPGTQDITCEVAWDQLAAVAQPVSKVTQATWLRAHGIDALVEQGVRSWSERSHAPDLEAIRGRSRAVEADALVDPSGLGAFDVVEWHVPVEQQI